MPCATATVTATTTMSKTNFRADSRLLDAEAAYAATCDRLGAERARLERALEILEGL